MYSEEIISAVTIIITLILGYFSKKSKFIANNLIPIQNLVIGIVVAIVEFIVTKNFSKSIAISGILAGGTYDIFHNIVKINEENNKKLN